MIVLSLERSLQDFFNLSHEIAITISGAIPRPTITYFILIR